MTPAEKLEAIRASLHKDAERKQTSGSFDNRFYPHYNIDVGQSVGLRFIEDGDKDNEWFWREKQVYDWTFADPEYPGEELRIKIPCRNMYEEKTDPVLKLISDMFNMGGAVEEKAKGLWVKRSYLYQGFPRKSPIDEENAPENPIRIFDISKSIHSIIYAALMETDEDLMLPTYPADAEKGLTFMVKKTKNGEYNSYNSSVFSPKVNSLEDDELAAIEQYGKWNLSELLPKMPSDAAYELLPDMLQAQIDGDPWNPDWEEHWKAWGAHRSSNSNDAENEGTNRSDDETPSKPAVKKAAPKKAETSDEGTSLKSASTQDVLSRLRAKKAEKEAS